MAFLALCVFAVVRAPGGGLVRSKLSRAAKMPQIDPTTYVTPTLGEWSGLAKISWMPEPVLEALDGVTLNAAVVTILGVWASYVVLNVDAEICRG
eukprot:scaffold157580_cov36-Tisochrysis_lutea.AAC.5